MNQVCIDFHNPYRPWNIKTAHQGTAAEVRVWTQGQAWVGDTYYEREALADWVCHELAQTSDPVDEFEEQVLQKLNGCFAIVVQTPDRVLAAADRVRSIALFYGLHKGHGLISDDARKVRDFVGDREPNCAATSEFLILGYVTGGDTLYPHVHQLQAGEWLCFKAPDGDLKYHPNRYYRFLDNPPFDLSHEEMLKKIDELWIRTFTRLVDSTRGKQLVIPLSGGLDSRLIAVTLKRLGAENVLCYTYGQPGNWEATISQRVAQTLGYRWHFVPYSRQAWSRWFHTEERLAYSRYSDGLAILPGYQEWPAVWSLKNGGLLSDEAVFVPGHNGGFVAGPSIPYPDNMVTPSELFATIYDRQHVLWEWHREVGALSSLFAERILSQIGDLPLDSPEQAISACRMWEWQERNAKFVNNFCRAYEFWGFDWRLPFWDNKVMSFWTRVPLPYRFQKRLYKAYLCEQYPEMFQKELLLDMVKKPSKPAKLSKTGMLFRLLPDPVASFLSHYLVSYFRHPMGWYGIHGFRKHLVFRTGVGLPRGEYATSPRYINSYLARTHLMSLAELG